MRNFLSYQKYFVNFLVRVLWLELHDNRKMRKRRMWNSSSSNRGEGGRCILSGHSPHSEIVRAVHNLRALIHNAASEKEQKITKRKSSRKGHWPPGQQGPLVVVKDIAGKEDCCL